MVEFFDAADSARLAEAFAIRLEVFVDEQGVPRELEIDELDAAGSAAVHAVVRDGGAAIATGRLYPHGAATVGIGRMAVRATHRGRGIGRFLLSELLAEAKRRAFTRAELSAQVAAAGFYERLGFVAGGGTYAEAGIEHQKMVRAL